MAWFTYDYETGKMHLKTEDFLLRNYGEHLQEVEENIYEHPCERHDAAAIEVTWSNFPYNDEQSVLTWEKLYDKIGYGVDLNQYV